MSNISRPSKFIFAPTSHPQHHKISYTPIDCWQALVYSLATRVVRVKVILFAAENGA